MKYSLIVFTLAVMVLSVRAWPYEQEDEMVSSKLDTFSMVQSLLESAEQEDEAEDMNLSDILKSLLKAVEVQQVRPSTEQPSAQPSRCLTEFYVMAFTSGEENADVKDSVSDKYVEISAGGQKIQKRLFNHKGPDDYSQNKGDLWKYDVKTDFGFKCLYRYEVSGIAIVAKDTDGWNIESIATFFIDQAGSKYTGSLDLGVDQWVDLDKKHPDRERFDLTMFG